MSSGDTGPGVLRGVEVRPGGGQRKHIDFRDVNLEEIKLAFENFYHVEGMDQQGQPVTMSIARCGRSGVVGGGLCHVLSLSPGLVKVPGNFGQSLIHAAIANSSGAWREALWSTLAHKCHEVVPGGIDCQAKIDSETPLLRAAQMRHLEAFKTLLYLGADTFAKNTKGQDVRAILNASIEDDDSYERFSDFEEEDAIVREKMLEVLDNHVPPSAEEAAARLSWIKCPGESCNFNGARDAIQGTIFFSTIANRLEDSRDMSDDDVLDLVGDFFPFPPELLRHISSFCVPQRYQFTVNADTFYIDM